MTKPYRRAPAPTREEYRASAVAKLRRIGYTDEEIRAFWRPSTEEEEEARRRLGEQASAG